MADFGVMAIIGIVGIIGMGVSAGITAGTYNSDSDKIDSAIIDAQNRYDDLKVQLDELVRNEVAIDEDIQNYINEQLTNIIDLQTQMEIVRKNSTKRYRTMEITGLIVITTVIFLFILKGFGVLGKIEAAFAGLFKKT